MKFTHNTLYHRYGDEVKYMARAQKVAKVGVKKQSGYLYFIDKDGDVARVAMNRGGKKKAAKKKKATKKKATKKKATKRKVAKRKPAKKKAAKKKKRR